jgi:CRISPR/Cas system-associated protein Cas10 (large subunit of type III CRISPR-Cas system)
MDRDEAAAIINRMMRQLEEEDASPKGTPRCDGCGRRVELAPYQRRMTDGGTETLYYCSECHAEAMIELLEDDDL